MSQEIIARAEDFLGAFGRLETRQTYLLEELSRTQRSLDQLEHDKKVVVKAKKTLDLVSQTIAEKGIGKIESIVTGGLGLVFGKGYRFIIEKKAGARGTTYRLLTQHRKVTGDTMDTFGGGVVNVVALILRVIMARRFKRVKFLALDESTNNVAAEYLPKVSALLQSLAHDHEYDILAVTHQQALAQSADHAYQVYADDNGEAHMDPIDPGVVVLTDQVTNG